MIWIVIPAKPFHEAKSRLAPLLTPPQRAELSRRLLLHVIELARSVGQVLVVSRDPQVRALAIQAEAQALAEARPGLNAAIRQGIGRARAGGGEAVLVLPTDLPLLTLDALAAFIALSAGLQPAIAIAPCRRAEGTSDPCGETRNFQSIAIAPCRRAEGTNALFMQPPDLIAPHFGPGSFAAHQAAAWQLGLTPLIHHSPELAFDLDTPADWVSLALTTSPLTHLTA